MNVRRYDVVHGELMNSEIMKHTFAGALGLPMFFLLSYWIGGAAGGALVCVVLFLVLYNNTVGPAISKGLLLAMIASGGDRTIAVFVSAVLILGATGAGLWGWTTGFSAIMSWFSSVSTRWSGYPINDALSLAIAGLVLGAATGAVGGVLDRDA